MNNDRGAAMLATLSAGALVTIRLPDGGQRTGRAHKVRNGWCICSMHPGSKGAITAGNIVRIQEG
jgi:hypothetical protein